jgi:hypothetical protein
VLPEKSLLIRDIYKRYDIDGALIRRSGGEDIIVRSQHETQS